MAAVTTNKRVISRLSRYKNALYRFRDLGFLKIFSDYLARAVGVTSSQVRKDFSLFGITGYKRGGYHIEELIERLNTILGKDEVQNVVIAGAGNIGRALAGYKSFSREGIEIVAAFDIDPSKYSAKDDLPVLSIDSMAAFVKKHDIRIGIIAVPDVAAQQVLDQMVAAGIRGVLNFAPIHLKAPAECVVNYVNLEIELESLIYFVNSAGSSQV